jgi:hypothetical protein
VCVLQSCFRKVTNVGQAVRGREWTETPRRKISAVKIRRIKSRANDCPVFADMDGNTTCSVPSGLNRLSAMKMSSKFVFPRAWFV